MKENYDGIGIKLGVGRKNIFSVLKTHIDTSNKVNNKLENIVLSDQYLTTYNNQYVYFIFNSDIVLNSYPLFENTNIRLLGRPHTFQI